MSIETITGRIVSDAVEYEKTLISDAKAEEKKILEQAKTEAEAFREQMKEKAAKDAAAMVQGKQKEAEMEARKMRLGIKQQMIDKSIETALSMLADMDQGDYIEILTERIIKIGLTEGQVLLNSKDRESIGSKFVDAANYALGNGKLTLSDDCIKAKGGFVIRHEFMDVDCTLETMVAAVKDAATPGLVEVLFEE